MKDSKQSGVKQVVNYPGIGNIQFIPSRKARYIRISIRPLNDIRVTIPYKATFQQALQFVEKKKDWILQAQTRMVEHEARNTLFTPETSFSTQSRKLEMIEWKSEKFRAQLTAGSLKVFYPQHVDLLSDVSQKIIRDYIDQAIRKEAKDYLPLRTKQLADGFGFNYTGVTIKNLVSRWGSCSGSNHINLNMHLVRLPRHLSDYVILHELVHTVHKNHGAGFWNCLDLYTDGNARGLSGEMKEYHAHIY